MTPKEVDQLIQKYLEGACTNEEASIVEKIYFMAGGLKAEMPKLSARQEAQLENSLKKKLASYSRQSRSLQSSRANRWYYAAAASILLAFGAAMYFLNQNAPALNVASNKAKADKAFFVNGTEISQTYALPDGSFITLSPNSKLHVAFDSLPNTRMVTLQGEAFFDVAPDKSKPFYVLTQRVVTKVLGTSFNIKAFDKDRDITVSVVEGKVSVAAANKENIHHEFILLPKQEAVFNKLRQTMKAKAVDQRLAVDGTFNPPSKFKEESVATILHSLEKSYHVTIAFDAQAFSTCRITTTFVDESLRDRLSIICAAIGATYKVTDDYHLEMENPVCSSN